MRGETHARLHKKCAKVRKKNHIRKHLLQNYANLIILYRLQGGCQTKTDARKRLFELFA